MWAGAPGHESVFFGLQGHSLYVPKEQLIEMHLQSSNENKAQSPETVIRFKREEITTVWKRQCNRVTAPKDFPQMVMKL